MWFSSLQIWKKEARRQSWEKQMLPEGQRWHLVVLVLVPATPTHPQAIQFLPTTRFSLQSGLEQWIRLLQQQVPKKKPKRKCWWDQKGSILIPSKTFFLKKECVQLLALDSLIFTGISCTPTVRQALFSAHRDPHHLRSPCFVHPHASETVADILLCCFRVTGCSYSMCLPKTSAHI